MLLLLLPLLGLQGSSDYEGATNAAIASRPGQAIWLRALELAQNRTVTVDVDREVNAQDYNSVSRQYRGVGACARRTAGLRVAP